jgi:outer membrane lipoprotein-sorting protein
MTYAMKSGCWLAAAWIGLTVSAARSETIEDVEKKVHELTKDVRTVKADFRTTMNYPNGAGYSVSEGKLEEMLDGQRFVANRYGKKEETLTLGGKEKKDSTEFLQVCDGRAQWIQETLMGRQVVYKRRPNSGPSFGGRLFPELKRSFTLELAPDARVAEQACWVVVARPQEPSTENGSVSHAIYYLRRVDGLVAKTEVYLRGQEKPFSTTLYSNYETNVTIDPVRFTYKVPEGFYLVDETVDVPPIQP